MVALLTILAYALRHADSAVRCFALEVIADLSLEAQIQLASLFEALLVDNSNVHKLSAETQFLFAPNCASL